MADFIRVKIRRGSTSGWAATNPVLELGEIAVDMDKHRLKVGNGSSRWSELAFCPVIVNDLVTGGVDAALSAEQGKLLKLELDTKASQDDLDALEQNIQTIISSGGIVAIDNLNSDDTVNALSAKQGKVLNEKLADKADKSDLENLRTELQQIISSGGIVAINNLDSDDTVNALSAAQGKVLNEKITDMKSTVDGLGIFGMSYTIDSFNNEGKPTQITFTDDGVICNLTWSSNLLKSIQASTGETMTITRDSYGRIIGRTVSRP